MHTYRRINERFQVGYFTMISVGREPPSSVWNVVLLVDDETEAQNWVNYLNGGPGVQYGQRLARGL